MARPLKIGLDYFPHDCDAAGDEKIEALRSIYGNNGFAFYFICLERIFRTENFELDLSDAEALVILAKKVRVSVKRLKQMLKTALKLKCFDAEAYNQKKVLTSSGIKKRAEIILNERERKRRQYEKSKTGKDSKRVSAGETPGEIGGETPQIKLKESILIDLANLVLRKVQTESSVYSVIGRFKNELGEGKLFQILSSCVSRAKKFDSEHKLAGYLQTCVRNNGGSHAPEELPLITGEKAGVEDG